MPEDLVPPALKLAARVATIVTGVALVYHAAHLRGLARKEVLWVVPLVFLLVKGLAQLATGILPGVVWAEMHGLRVLYLHVMLLGFISGGMVVSAYHIGYVGSRRCVWSFMMAVVVLLVTLLPLTGIWPTSLAGVWSLRLAALAAILPVLAAAGFLLRACNKVTTRPV